MARVKGSKNWSAAEVERLRRLAGEGITRRDAARRLGRDASTVYRRVAQLGLEWLDPPPRPGAKPLKAEAIGYWTGEDDRLVKALAKAGWTHGVGRGSGRGRG